MKWQRGEFFLSFLKEQQNRCASSRLARCNFCDESVGGRHTHIHTHTNLPATVSCGPNALDSAATWRQTSESSDTSDEAESESPPLIFVLSAFSFPCASSLLATREEADWLQKPPAGWKCFPPETGKMDERDPSGAETRAVQLLLNEVSKQDRWTTLPLTLCSSGHANNFFPPVLICTT